jgi:hypothetical protein
MNSNPDQLFIKGNDRIPFAIRSSVLGSPPGEYSLQLEWAIVGM